MLWTIHAIHYVDIFSMLHLLLNKRNEREKKSGHFIIIIVVIIVIINNSCRIFPTSTYEFGTFNERIKWHGMVWCFVYPFISMVELIYECSSVQCFECWWNPLTKRLMSTGIALGILAEGRENTNMPCLFERPTSQTGLKSTFLTIHTFSLTSQLTPIKYVCCI